MPVADTSIDCFHGRVQNSKTHQQAEILAAMEMGKVYTGQQLSHLTGLTPNIISARLFELREQNDVERAGKAICPYSHVNVYVHRKVVKQLEFA